MQQPNISVGIMKSEQIQFFLSGNYKISGLNNYITSNCEVSYINNEILVKESNEIVFKGKEVEISPTDFSTNYFELKDVVIGINFHWEQKENQRFRGFLKFIIEQNKIWAINILPLESYLTSVISSEMNANSSMELLKAHAVISRSWLVAQIEKQQQLATTANTLKNVVETEGEYIKWYDREDHQLFDVCADDHCQRYQGITRAHNSNVIKAILDTYGQVLGCNSEIADTRFSKCCGGISERFENCWQPEHYPYLVDIADVAAPLADVEPSQINNSKPDLTIEKNAVQWILSKPEAFCNNSDVEILNQVLNDYDQKAKDFYRWKISYTQNELSELIKRKSKRDFGQILDLIPIQRGQSGRLIKLQIVGTKQILTVGKELEIRRWLSESHLYSSAFVVEKIEGENGVPTKFLLHGAGWGHGVGLCQIGAAVMGHKGYLYTEILEHYFKQTTIEKRY